MGPADLGLLIPSPGSKLFKTSNLGSRKLSVIPYRPPSQQVVLGFYLNCLEQQEVLMKSSPSVRLEKLHELQELSEFLL